MPWRRADLLLGLHCRFDEERWQCGTRKAAGRRDEQQGRRSGWKQVVNNTWERPRPRRDRAVQGRTGKLGRGHGQLAPDVVKAGSFTARGAAALASPLVASQQSQVRSRTDLPWDVPCSGDQPHLKLVTRTEMHWRFSALYRAEVERPEQTAMSHTRARTPRVLHDYKKRSRCAPRGP